MDFKKHTDYRIFYGSDVLYDEMCDGMKDVRMVEIDNLYSMIFSSLFTAMSTTKLV